MKRSEELALAVLQEAGIIEAEGDWYRFTGSTGIKLSPVQSGTSMVKQFPAIPANGNAVIVGGRLPWLVAREGSTYNPVTPEQKLICAYKLSKKIDWQSREWDKFNYKRYAKGCKKLLAAFDGNDQEAAHWLLDFGDKFDHDELTWNLDTAANHAWMDKGQREQAK